MSLHPLPAPGTCASPPAATRDLGAVFDLAHSGLILGWLVLTVCVLARVG